MNWSDGAGESSIGAGRKQSKLLKSPKQTGVLVEEGLKFVEVLLAAGVSPDPGAVSAFHPQPSVSIPLPRLGA